MSYDYIIVGAGAVGPVLANRLTEDPKNLVLPLEANGMQELLAVYIPRGLSGS